MSQVDARAVFVFMALVAMSVALFLALLWRRDRDHHLWLWTVAFTLSGFGHALVGLRGLISATTSIVLANMVLLTALLLMAAGLRALMGFSLTRWHYGFYAAAVLLSGGMVRAYTGVHDDINARIWIMSMFLGIGALGVPLLVFRDPERRSQSLYLAVALSFMAFSALIFLRIPITLLRPVHGDVGSLTVNQLIYMSTQMFLEMFWGVGFVALHAERVMGRLQTLSNTDALSGLLTRRAMDEALTQAITSAAASGEPLSVLMLDIDHFKQINDRHGHHLGDQAIAHVGRCIAIHLRHGDIAGRYGGDEFCVVLPGANAFQAQGVAHRLCRADYRLERDGADPLVLTVSVGVALLDSGGAGDLSSLLRAADTALYGAKRAGRDQVMVAAGLVGT